MAEIGSFFVTLGTKFDGSGIDKGQQAMTGLQGLMSRVVITAGDIYNAMARVTTTIVDFGRKSLKAAQEQENADNMLIDALQRRGYYTDELFKKYTAFANVVQLTTKYTEEEVEAVQTSMTNAGAQGDMLISLTKATMDFATAKRMDLVSAGDLLSKTIQGEVNALGRYGVSIEGAAGSTERMEQVTKNVERLWGGSTAAAAQTFSGRMAILTNKFNEMYETLGFQLMPILETVFNVFEQSLYPVILKFVNSINATPASLKTFADSLNFIVRAGYGVYAVLDVLATTVKGMYYAFTLQQEKFNENEEALKNKIVDHGTQLAALANNTVEVAKTAEEKRIAFVKAGANRTQEIQVNATKQAIERSVAVFEAEFEMGKKTLAQKQVFYTNLLAMTAKGTKEEADIRKKLYDTEQELMNRTFVGGWTNALKTVKETYINYKDVFMSATQSMSSATATVFEQFINGEKNMLQSIGGFFDAMKGIIVKKASEILAEKVVQGLISFLSGGTGASAALGFGGLLLAGVGSFLKFADGGISTAQTMAQVDANELHLPLDSPKTTDALAVAMTKAQNVNASNTHNGNMNITINAPSIDLNNVDEIARRLRDRIREGGTDAVNMAKTAGKYAEKYQGASY